METNWSALVAINITQVQKPRTDIAIERQNIVEAYLRGFGSEINSESMEFMKDTRGRILNDPMLGLSKSLTFKGSIGA